MKTPSLWAELTRHYWRDVWLLALLLVLVGLPWILLLVAGFTRLWEYGQFGLWWLGMLALLGAAFLVYQFGIRRRPPHRVKIAPADPGAAPGAERAREDLARLARQVTAEDLKDADAVQRLLIRTVRTVADAHTPGDESAVWRFTVPEALLMLEDVSHRLRGTLVREVPILRSIELTWLFKALDIAEPYQRLESLFRIVRWVNPTSAVAAQLRGLLTSKVIDVLGTAAQAQVAAILVEEVGDAAIALYAGVYRRKAEERLPTTPPVVPDIPEEPVTLLLAGQPKAGKSSLLNALLGLAREPVGLTTAGVDDCRAYRFSSEHAGTLILVDSPGSRGQANAAWLQQAIHSDLVLWVVAANRADRAADEESLARLRALTAQDPRLRPIPIVAVLTHADRLDPPLEWSPPYDVEQGQGTKEQHMREARRAISRQLGIPLHRCVPVAVPLGEPAWNLDSLGRTIQQALPEAKQKQLERGRRPDGWFRMTTDGMRSVQGVGKAAGKVVKDMIGRVSEDLRGKGPR
jgi:predicted GTPase